MSEQTAGYKIPGKPSTIFKTVKNKDNPYVMIDRRPIDNPELSFKAKGILTYLMSRPDGWEVSIADLVKHGDDGEASIRSGMKELREAGHIRSTASRNEGRITGWLIEVFEVPNPGNVTQPPGSDFQQVENQDVENRTQVLKTLSPITEFNNYGAKPAPILLSDMPVDWQMMHTDNKITLPPPDQQWQAEVDIAAMGICRSGVDLEPLATAFMKARHILPAGKMDYKNWAGAFRAMINAKVTPDIITLAVQKLSRANMTIADPWAIKKTAIDMANPIVPESETPAVSGGNFYA